MFLEVMTKEDRLTLFGKSLVVIGVATVGVITAIEPRWLLFWSCGLIWYDMPMSLAWFMLEDPSITKSFHQKNLPWPSSSHHWIHQVADYLTSSHTDGAATVCMQLLFNHRTRQDCPRDGELGCCHSTGYKDFFIIWRPLTSITL